MHFLSKRILSYKNTVEYFYKLFLIANLNKLYEKRSNTSIIYVWLDTKASFNDNFTRPKGYLHIQETDTCKRKGKRGLILIFLTNWLGFFLYIFLKQIELSLGK